MSKVLHLPAASSVLDLIHPKLRARFREANLSTEGLEDITRPEIGRGIRPLTAEESRVLGGALRAIEKAVGERPTHAFWTRKEHSFSLTFVVQSEGGWYLTPSANPGVPDVTKHQPPPPPN